MKDQCPVCRRKDCIIEIAYMNTDAYGGNGHKVACKYCGAPLVVAMHKEVVIDSIKLQNFTRDDWGNPCDFETAKRKYLERQRALAKKHDIAPRKVSALKRG